MGGRPVDGTAPSAIVNLRSEKPPRLIYFRFPPPSIRLERQTVIHLQRRILLVLLQHAVADHEQIECVAHEAAEGVFGRADDRFAAEVEGGVDQDRAAGLSLGGAQQLVKARISIAVHGLDARGIMDRHGL